MVLSQQIVHCPRCESNMVSFNSKSGNDKQWFIYNNKLCDKRTFISDYLYPACKKKIYDKVVDMALNGSGIRDTSRVLKISTGRDIRVIKKSKMALARNRP